MGRGERREMASVVGVLLSLTTITALLAVIIITAEPEPNLCSFPPDLAKTTVHRQPQFQAFPVTRTIKFHTEHKGRFGTKSTEPPSSQICNNGMLIGMSCD